MENLNYKIALKDVLNTFEHFEENYQIERVGYHEIKKYLFIKHLTNQINEPKIKLNDFTIELPRLEKCLVV